MATPPDLADFPDARIVWKKWSAKTETEFAQRERPILLFVADPDPMVFPFLRTVFQAMPKNARLRDLLHQEFPALYVEAGAISEPLSAFGAGRQYHIAVLSPYGLNPLVVFDPVRGDAAALVAEIVSVLERLLPAWRQPAATRRHDRVLRPLRACGGEGWATRWALYLRGHRLCRRLPDFAHIAMVHSGHLTIVPGDGDCVPTRFGDAAAVGGNALPIDAATLLEGLGFGVGHRSFPILPWHRRLRS
jgi:hypothetical protein